MRNVSKVIAGTACGLTALIFICVLALSPQNSVQAPISSVPAPSGGETGSRTVSSVPETNAKAIRYIIQSEGDTLSVYREGEENPIEIIELDVSALPLVDQQLLEKGIPVSSKEDLTRLLEDLCS